MRSYDVLIVGGSFAGLACARTASMRGLDVCVIDARPEPGARVRTTGILVKEATDDFDVPSRLLRKCAASGSTPLEVAASISPHPATIFRPPTRPN